MAQVRLADSSLIPVNRTGLWEGDLLRPRTQQVFAQAALHYRITPKLEAAYDGRFATADPIVRHENVYAFARYRVQYRKLDLRARPPLPSGLRLLAAMTQVRGALTQKPELVARVSCNREVETGGGAGPAPGDYSPWPREKPRSPSKA